MWIAFGVGLSVRRSASLVGAGGLSAPSTLPHSFVYQAALRRPPSVRRRRRLRRRAERLAVRVDHAVAGLARHHLVEPLPRLRLRRTRRPASGYLVASSLDPLLPVPVSCCSALICGAGETDPQARRVRHDQRAQDEQRGGPAGQAGTGGPAAGSAWVRSTAVRLVAAAGPVDATGSGSTRREPGRAPESRRDGSAVTVLRLRPAVSP